MGDEGTAEDDAEELPFTAELTETGGSVRLTVPAAVRKALRLEAGDFLGIPLKKRAARPLVIDNKTNIRLGAGCGPSPNAPIPRGLNSLGGASAHAAVDF